jgi:tetraacyldisaccharide 4'-kinase
VDVTAWREFPDHFPYGSRDRESLAAWASERPVEAVICTQKDLVKLARSELAGKPLWALRIGLAVLTGQAELEARLCALAAL